MRGMYLVSDMSWKYRLHGGPEPGEGDDSSKQDKQEKSPIRISPD